MSAEVAPAPCPHCGSELRRMNTGPATAFQHPTADCLHAAEIFLGDQIEHWNRRVIPDDVTRLVIAARMVAFESPVEHAAMAELDQASEAFASRVPWDDEPTDDEAAGQ